MIQLWKNIILPGIIMLLLDAIFIYSNMNMFKLQVADVQRVSLQIKPLGAFLSYVFLIFGLYYFILREHRSIIDAMIFGFVLYGVYETTTYALLKKWRIKTMVIDTLWGGTLMGLTTLITYKLTKQ